MPRQELERTRSHGALRRAFQSPALRRVQLSWGASRIAYSGWVVTLNAVAYTQGGVWAVGLVLAVHSIPGALSTPVLTVLAERWGLMRGLSILAWIRATAMVASAVSVCLGWPLGLLIAFAALEGFGSEPYDSVQVAVLPWLARSPEELTAANSVTELFRMLGILLGPALATLLLTFSEPTVAFLACAGVSGFGVWFLRGLRDSVPRSSVMRSARYCRA